MSGFLKRTYNAVATAIATSLITVEATLIICPHSDTLIFGTHTDGFDAFGGASFFNALDACSETISALRETFKNALLKCPDTYISDQEPVALGTKVSRLISDMRCGPDSTIATNTTEGCTVASFSLYNPVDDNGRLSSAQYSCLKKAFKDVFIKNDAHNRDLDNPLVNVAAKAIIVATLGAVVFAAKKFFDKRQRYFEHGMPPLLAQTPSPTPSDASSVSAGSPVAFA